MEFLDYLFEKISILEVTADEKYTKQYNGKLDRTLFDKAVELDPTSIGNLKVGRYVDWIIRNKLFDIDKDEIRDVLNTFEKYKSKIDLSKRDINKLTYDVVKDLVNNIKLDTPLSKKEKKDIDREQAEKESEVVYKSDQYVIVVPHTEFASCYFGAGADWCTARREHYRNMFSHYDRNGSLYIILDKKTKEKFQLFKSENNREVEYKDSSNRNFDPFERFSDDDELIKWLEENEFKNTSELTEEEARELAEEFLSYVGFDYQDDGKLYEDSIDILKNYFLGFNDFEYEMDDLFDYIKRDELGDLVYEFKKTQEIIDKQGINSKHPKNMTTLISFISPDMSYEFEQYFEKGRDFNDLSEIEWVYYYDESVEDMIERFSEKRGSESINDFDDVDLNYIEKWLEYHYHQDDTSFEDFYEDFIKSFEDNINKMTDEQKNILKELVDKVAYIEYGKAGHPSLDLQHYIYKPKYF